MSALMMGTRFNGVRPVAEVNRQRLRHAGVLAINVVGGPGCGKTSLIDATIDRLRPDVRVGVIACDVAAHSDADRIMCQTREVVQVNTGLHGAAEAGDVEAALDMFDLTLIDLLFIENVGTLVGPVTADLGQDATAAVFSVAGGHDKAEKHADLVRAADVVLLNKTDLIPAVPFNLPTFRSDAHRLNRSAPLHEISALRGTGMEPWVQWLQARIAASGVEPSGWFG